jgi:4-amino-4-deoxy-L-arabinose transferase-like glycosyltransferase
MSLKSVAGDNTHPFPRIEKPHLYLAILIGLLLLIFAGRTGRLNTLNMDEDEVWSVWQTFGSPADIINWTPSDWSPLYYLIVGLWKGLVGIHPFALRILSVLPFTLAMAVLYRFTRRVYSAPAGIIAVAACAAMGYAIHISTSLRAYGILFCVTILAWWLAIRYFTRPTLVRALPLALCLGVMVYLHISSLFAIIILGLYTLIIYRRESLRWWLPGGMVLVLILPIIINKLAVTVAHVDQASSGSMMSSGWHPTGRYYSRLCGI